MNGNLEACCITENVPSVFTTSESWRREQKLEMEEEDDLDILDGSDLREDFRRSERGVFHKHANDDGIANLKREHAVVLTGLQEQVEELQQKCTDLQICLAMKLPYVSQEAQEQVAELERKMKEREEECVELRLELFTREKKEMELRKEIFLKEQKEASLARTIALKDRDLERLQRAIQSTEKEAKTIKLAANVRENRPQCLMTSSDTKHVIPTPPPKSAKDKIYSRPMNLYRRILSLSSRSIFNNENHSSSESPTEPRRRASSSSIPHLPQIARMQHNLSPPTAAASERPLVRQQLRVKKWNTVDLPQKVTVDHLSHQQCPMQQLQSEHFNNNF